MTGWQTRFGNFACPLPAFPGWQNISMPPAREHAEGEGLSFWMRYMNPPRLAEIQASITSSLIPASFWIDLAQVKSE
jgi:hypothetical protein